METGLIIRRLRENEGRSQLDLANELGITRVYLSQLENGRKHASIDVLRSIASHYAVPISLLLAWEAQGEDDEINKELQKLFLQLLEAKLKRGE